MNLAKQLYQLQEIDQELESNEQALEQLLSQLGENQKVVSTKNKLASEQQHLGELKGQQHSAEWEIDGLTEKLTTDEGKLYSGSIKNPKELTDIQHEVDSLKARRSQLEDKALEIMEQVEKATANVAGISSELNRLETEWHSQQQQLSSKIEELKSALSKLNRERQLLSDEIDPQMIELYSTLRKQKGMAVARVEQGICIGCRISLPTTDLQRVRSSRLVQCSSCGRILFLA